MSPANPKDSSSSSRLPVDYGMAAVRRILYGQGVAVAVAGAVMAIAAWFLSAAPGRLALLSAFVLAVGVSTVLLAFRGRTRAAGAFLVVSVWLIGTAAAATAGGLRAPSIGIQLAVVVLAGLVLSWRAGVISAVLTIATVFALAWAEANDALPEAAELTVWAQVTILAVITVLVAQAVAIAVWNRQHAIEEELRELERRGAAEAELAESRAVLSAVIEGTSDAVFVKDLAGRYRYVNSAAAGLFGVAEEDVLGAQIDALLPPTQAALIAKSDWDVLVNEHPSTAEMFISPIHGKPRWTLSTRGPLTLSDGTVIGVYSISRDITARKDAEERMRATLASLLDPHVLVEAVRDESGQVVDFVCLDANDAAADYFGLARENVCGSSLYTSGSAVANADVLPLWIDTVETGRPIILDGYPIFNVRSGATRRYDLRGVRVGDGVSFTWRDVTSRYEMEASLRRRIEELDALQRISTLLAESSDLQAALDDVGRQVNELFRADSTQIHLAQTEAAGTTPAEAAAAPSAPAGSPQLSAPEVREALRRGLPVGLDDATGGGRLLAVPMVSGLATIGLLVVARTQGDDFSEREIRVAQPIADALAAKIMHQQLHERAKRQAADQARQSIARDLHEAVMQTIAAANIIAASMPAVWEHSHEVGLHELERLRRLVQAALAEMRTLLLELRPATLDVTPLEALLQRLGEALEGRADLEVELSVTPKLEVPRDVKLALYRVAQEALSNVSKHAGASEVNVRVTGDDTGVRLTVRDDGLGLDLDTLSVDTGFQAMRDRAAEIGASLTIDSRLDRGTTVSVFWPRPDNPPLPA